MIAAAALRAGAAALLAARGEPELGAVVAAADVELVGPGEPWQMGAREVLAHRVALVVDAPVHAALARDPSKVAAIRGAFEAAMKTPETALAELAVVLRLPPLRVGWHRAYREASPSYDASRPDPPAVLGGALALLTAAAALRGGAGSPDGKAAAILQRATLEAAEVAGSMSPPLVRYAVRLDPPDLALVERAPEIAQRIQRAVHGAGTRAAEAVSSVELCAALRGLTPKSAGPEGLLTRAIEALGVTVIPVARGGEGGEDEGGSSVTLAVIGGGEVRIVEVGQRGGGGLRGGRGASQASAEVVAFAVAAGDVSDDAGARSIAAAVCAGIAGTAGTAGVAGIA